MREFKAMADFHYDRDADGAAVISWDVPRARMNTMSLESMEEMAGLFEKAFSDSRVKGIVLTSGKPDFSGGMDLRALAQMRDRAESGEARDVFNTVMRIHRILRGIELAGGHPKDGRRGKPVVAALPGICVGIGYEIAVACHRIIVADSPRAVIGLPEIKVGLFPGAGGTTRLVRRLGVEAAAPLLLKGLTPSPAAALGAGTVDEIAEPGKLLERAREWALRAGADDVIKPWDRKGARMPGGRPYDAGGYMSFVGVCAMVSGGTACVYPAVNALMSAIYEGALAPFDKALEIEARWFTKALLDRSSANMVRTLFVSKKALEKGVRRPAAAKTADLRRIGVVGAGMMGSGIAFVAARAGMEVVLIDRDAEAAARGKNSVKALLDRQPGSKRAQEDKARRILERISAGEDFQKLRDADLVIEAVYEDPAVKAEVISRIDSAADCVIASNTSTLPISGLADACRSPDRFLGMHFFSPVDRMMLVEVIRGKTTADPAVALSLDFVARIRKTPIVVNDARFFYANRCIIPYLNEGIRMVGEGVSPALVENAAKHSGMPVGPLQLIDETSIDLAVSIAEATRWALGPAYAHEDADRVISELASIGRLGRKSNSGFYDYDDSGKRTGIWPGLKERFPVRDSQPAAEDVKNRLLMIQTLEAVRAFEEGVLTDVREGDVGAVLGWGFAPWSGGPFSWLDMMGAGSAAAMCDELRKRHGARFKVPDLLRRKAAAGERFTAR